MSERPHRRAALRLLAGAALSPFGARAEGPRDQGIGGTGFSLAPEDRGIGGTGVIGIIRRFGSIVVNDLRIDYPPDVVVRIDGRPGALSDLRRGHVVEVLATQGGRGFATREIGVTHEVVGPVTEAAGGRLRVLGQEVFAPAARAQAGDWVAVSGLRRTDGVIVASLVEPAAPGAARVVGPVSGGAIGGLALAGLGPALDGRRVLVEGQAAEGRFTPVATVPDPQAALFAAARQVLIETYAAPSAGGLRLGSGLFVQGARGRPGAGRQLLSALPSGAGLRDGRLAPAPGGGSGGPERAPPGRADAFGPRAGQPGSPTRAAPGRGGDLPVPRRPTGGDAAPAPGPGGRGGPPATIPGAGPSGLPDPSRAPDFGRGGFAPPGVPGGPGGGGFGGPAGPGGAPGFGPRR